MKMRTGLLITTLSLLCNLFVAPFVLATEVTVPPLEQNNSLENEELVIEDTSLPIEDSSTFEESVSVEESEEHSTIFEGTTDTISENDTSVDKDPLEITPMSIITGIWGTSPVSYETSTRTLTVSAGIIDNTSTILNAQSTIRINQISHIVFEDGVVAPENSSNLFSGFGRFNLLNSITGNLDTSNVTDMSSMFSDTSNLNSADISNWNTSKVTDMSFMFKSSNLPLQDLNSWNTSNVINMSGMFERANNLTDLNISDWDTSNVTNMSSMFTSVGGLLGLTNIDLNNWDTSKVVDMSSMFSSSGNLTNLNISNWNTSKVVDMSFMFHDNISLTSLNISNWDIANVTNMNSMFSRTALESLSINNWDTSNVTDMESMFADSHKLKELNLSNWDTSNVTNMVATFSDTWFLSKLDISGWTISDITNTASMFFRSKQLQTLIIGEKTQFNKSINHGIDISLPSIDTTSGQYTGAWERVDPITPISVYKSSFNFMNTYDGSQPGTYIWQEGKAEFTVDFNSNGGSSIPSQLIVANETTIKPTDPTKEGYTFAGWYVDKALTQLFDFDTPITQATTLYAKWTENGLPIGNYPVDFNSNGGSSIPSQLIVANETITKPTDPTKEGYTFAGWYVDEALTQLFDFDTPITQATTLYAKWTKIDTSQKNQSSISKEKKASKSDNSSTGKQLPSTGETNSFIVIAWGLLLLFVTSRFILGRNKLN